MPYFTNTHISSTSKMDKFLSRVGDIQLKCNSAHAFCNSISPFQINRQVTWSRHIWVLKGTKIQSANSLFGLLLTYSIWYQVKHLNLFIDSLPNTLQLLYNLLCIMLAGNINLHRFKGVISLLLSICVAFGKEKVLCKYQIIVLQNLDF